MREKKGLPLIHTLDLKNVWQFYLKIAFHFEMLLFGFPSDHHILNELESELWEGWVFIK